MKTIIFYPIAIGFIAACSSTPAPFQHSQTGFTPPPSQVHDARIDIVQAPKSPSIWAMSPTALLSTRRANGVGDLLTVVVEMDDQANLQNSLTRTRNSNEDLNIDALFGLPDWAGGLLPGTASLSPGIDINRNSDLSGSGAVRRAEKVTFQLASRVIGVEPNGNLVIQGYQQTMVSNEVRYLSVSGVIRARDVSRDNTVSYEKIADARLAYVSSGEATSAVKRSAVPKLLDKVVPF